MELLIDEDEKIANIQSRNGIVQSSLSVIMESSQQTIAKKDPNGVGLITTIEDSRFRTSEQIEGGIFNSQNSMKPQEKKFDRKVIQAILASDSEEESMTSTGINIANVPERIIGEAIQDKGSPAKLPKSRLSFLSKLNLMGLIDLSMVTVGLKLNRNVDEAIRFCEEAVLNLKV